MNFVEDEDVLSRRVRQHDLQINLKEIEKNRRVSSNVLLKLVEKYIDFTSVDRYFVYVRDEKENTIHNDFVCKNNKERILRKIGDGIDDGKVLQVTLRDKKILFFCSFSSDHTDYERFPKDGKQCSYLFRFSRFFLDLLRCTFYLLLCGRCSRLKVEEKRNEYLKFNRYHQNVQKSVGEDNRFNVVSVRPHNFKSGRVQFPGSETKASVLGRMKSIIFSMNNESTTKDSFREIVFLFFAHSNGFGIYYPNLLRPRILTEYLTILEILEVIYEETNDRDYTPINIIIDSCYIGFKNHLDFIRKKYRSKTLRIYYPRKGVTMGMLFEDFDFFITESGRKRLQFQIPRPNIWRRILLKLTKPSFPRIVVLPGVMPELFIKTYLKVDEQWTVLRGMDKVDDIFCVKEFENEKREDGDSKIDIGKFDNGKILYEATVPETLYFDCKDHFSSHHNNLKMYYDLTEFGLNSIEEVRKYFKYGRQFTDCQGSGGSRAGSDSSTPRLDEALIAVKSCQLSRTKIAARAIKDLSGFMDTWEKFELKKMLDNKLRGDHSLGISFSRMVVEIERKIERESNEEALQALGRIKEKDKQFKKLKYRRKGSNRIVFTEVRTYVYFTEDHYHSWTKEKIIDVKKRWSRQTPKKKKNNNNNCRKNKKKENNNNRKNKKKMRRKK